MSRLASAVAGFMRRGRGAGNAVLLLAWVAVVLFPAQSPAAVSAAAFESANKLYEEGKFADAASAYETLARSGAVLRRPLLQSRQCVLQVRPDRPCHRRLPDGRANHPARPGPARQPAIRAKPNARPDPAARPLAALARAADSERMDAAGRRRGLALAAPVGRAAMAARRSNPPCERMSSPWPYSPGCCAPALPPPCAKPASPAPPLSSPATPSCAMVRWPNHPPPSPSTTAPSCGSWIKKTSGSRSVPVLAGLAGSAATKPLSPVADFGCQIDPLVAAQTKLLDG